MRDALPDKERSLIPLKSAGSKGIGERLLVEVDWNVANIRGLDREDAGELPPFELQDVRQINPPDFGITQFGKPIGTRVETGPKNDNGRNAFLDGTPCTLERLGRTRRYLAAVDDFAWNVRESDPAARRAMRDETDRLQRGSIVDETRSAYQPAVSAWRFPSRPCPRTSSGLRAMP